MSFSLDNIMECVTVEIKCEKSKNVIISCVYRVPGSNIDTFEDKMTEIFNSISNNKHLFVCGDFNIDLLNPHNQSQITSFINSVFCMGLYPTITHPSRITVNTATLIDNILTNVTEGNLTGGLLISDVSDHLPVFAAFESSAERNYQKETRNLTRKITNVNIENLRKDLWQQNWTEIYVDDIDKSYE